MPSRRSDGGVTIKPVLLTGRFFFPAKISRWLWNLHRAYEFTPYRNFRSGCFAFGEQTRTRQNVFFLVVRNCLQILSAGKRFQPAIQVPMSCLFFLLGSYSIYTQTRSLFWKSSLASNKVVKNASTDNAKMKWHHKITGYFIHPFQVPEKLTI